MKRSKRGNCRKAFGSNNESANGSNKKTTYWEATIFDLPECVLLEIFLRLPALSILCCKGVCKAWYVLLSQSCFSTVYMRTPPYMHLVFSNMITLRSSNPKDLADAFHLISYKERQEFSQNPICTKKLHLPRKSYLVIKGSCNGLICLVQYTRRSRIFHISNPMTREYISLPQLSSSRRLVHTAFGFGFHTHYKVICIQTYRLPKGELSVDGSIFTIGVDSKWRELGNVSASLSVKDFAIILEEAFHWLVDHKPMQSLLIDNLPLSSICAFDIGEETFKSIPPPPGVNYSGAATLGILRNKLCILYCSTSLNHLDIWTMNEYGNEQSWTRDFILNSWITLEDNYQYVHPPIASWRDGELLSYAISSCQLISYNQREKGGYTIKIPGFEGLRYPNVVVKLITYIPNFVPLREVFAGRFSRIYQV